MTLKQKMWILKWKKSTLNIKKSTLRSQNELSSEKLKKKTIFKVKIWR